MIYLIAQVMTYQNSPMDALGANIVVAKFLAVVVGIMLWDELKPRM
jgi:hypothetical protein